MHTVQQCQRRLHEELALSNFMFIVVMDRLTGDVRREASSSMISAEEMVIRNKTIEDVDVTN